MDPEDVRGLRLMAIGLLIATLKRDSAEFERLAELVDLKDARETALLLTAICTAGTDALQIVSGGRSEAEQVLEMMRTDIAGGGLITGTT